MLEVLASVSRFVVSTPALVGICLAAFAFFVGIFAVTCFCHRSRHSPYGSHKFFGSKKFKADPEKSLAFHHHKKPTAVKSPAGSGGNTHYLKKSPSPTSGKSPPGSSSASSPINPDHRSPVAELPPSPEIQKSALIVSNASTCQLKNEKQKPTTPSKEDVESSEKNITSGKLGQIVFKLRYKNEKNALVVSVVKCRDLPAKDSNTDSSDPYVKLQLLPDKQHKVKTRVLRKTRNPIYDEDFTFYGINKNQLQVMTLHFVILSFDRYSRDDIIGEVFCSLASVDISQIENQQLAFCREIQPRSLKIRSQGRGEILISLCWQPAANRLTVVILKARNLPKMDVTGLAAKRFTRLFRLLALSVANCDDARSRKSDETFGWDPYVKMYLLYKNQRIAKKKTHVKKRTLNPVFNESFVFEIPAGTDKLDNISLEFLLLDWDRVTKNEVIGRLELGGEKATGVALHHWNEVCNSPRRQIAEWHKLKE